jgi:hypothetical protein
MLSEEWGYLKSISSNKCNGCTFTDCRLFLYVLALGKEASEHDCTRHSQALGAKVSFSHEGLHGD